MRPEPDPGSPGPPSLSRRSLLAAGTGAFALLLGACSSDSGTKKAVKATKATPGATKGKISLAQMFDPRVPVGTPLRLPLGLVDGEGVFLKDPPAAISARLGPEDGDLGPSIELSRRDEGLERAYFPLLTTLATPGSWRLEVTAAGQTLESTLSALGPTDMPGRVVQPGEQLPAIATPTTASPREVNPICTAEPPCPLHEVSLDRALTIGKPIALLVSTPAFCQTSICGPVLDLFVDQGRAFGESVTMMHIEVYTDNTAKKTADTVEALGLTYEPSLFLAAPDGTLSERLDFIFDTGELAEGLARLVP